MEDSGRAEAHSCAPQNLEIEIGTRRWPISCLEEEVGLFVAARKRFARGASGTPVPGILLGGNQIAYISYNGRVWAGLSSDWKPGDQPIFDPSLVADNCTASPQSGS